GASPAGFVPSKSAKSLLSSVVRFLFLLSLSKLSRSSLSFLVVSFRSSANEDGTGETTPAMSARVAATASEPVSDANLRLQCFTRFSLRSGLQLRSRTQGCPHRWRLTPSRNGVQRVALASDWRK